MLPHTRHPRTIATLNELVRASKDSEERFLSAADRVSDQELKQMLNEYSLERAQFASRLQWEVRHLGGDPEYSASFGETFLRGVRNMKTLLVGENDAAEVETCQQGEQLALQEYSRALKSPLPENVRSMVEHQHGRIKETQAVLRKLKQSLQSGAKA